MLQLIRDNAQGIVIWIIVGFVILGLSSFILSSYDIGNVKNYVAKVNDATISSRDYQFAMNNYRQQLQQSLGENYSRFFNETLMRDTVVNGLVNNSLLNQITIDAGLRTSATQVYQRIEKNPLFKDEDGKFSSEQYDNFLNNIGYSREQYEAEIAKFTVEEQLRNGVTRSAFVLQTAVKDLEQLTAQQRRIDYLQVEKNKVLTNIKVSDEEIQAHYDENKTQYQTAEQVTVDYLELNLQDMVTTIEIDSEEANGFYEQNIARYRQEEERRASHILIKLDEKTDFAAATEKLTALKQELAAGKSFAELAKAHSQDIGSAKNGGDIGVVGRDQTDKPFENALYGLELNQVSEPVQSQFGVHLIQLTELLPGKVKPFAEVKPKIEQELRNQKAERLFYEYADRLDKLAYEHQDTLEPAAEDLGQKIKQSPYFSRQGAGQIWRNTAVLNAAFSDEVLNEGINSELLRLSDDHLIVIRLKDHKQPEQKAIEQVRGLIQQKLRQEKAQAKVAEILTAAYEQVKDKNAAVDEVAKDYAVATAYQAGFIGRETKYDENQTNANKVRTEIRRQTFNLPGPAKDKPTIEQLTAANGDGYIIVLHEVRDNPKQTETTVLESMQQQLANTVGQAEQRLLLEYKRANSEIDINLQEQDDSF